LRPGNLIEAADAAKHRGRNTVVEHCFVQESEDAAEVAMAG
jgi:hypothetical protein